VSTTYFLLISREEAEQKIRLQIDKGLSLKDAPVASWEEIEEFLPKKARWSDYNVELLKRIFDNPSVSTDYQSKIYKGSSWRALHLDRAQFYIQKYLDRELDFLESLVERLELVPVLSEESAPTEIPQTSVQPTEIVKDPRVVFVVHGRDEKARNSLFTFLRSIGLAPREWSELIRDTGKGSPYIGDVQTPPSPSRRLSLSL
jgi:hypothetical protein